MFLKDPVTESTVSGVTFFLSGTVEDGASVFVMHFFISGEEVAVLLISLLLNTEESLAAFVMFSFILLDALTVVFFPCFFRMKFLEMLGSVCL